MGQGKMMNGASAMGFAPASNTSTVQAQNGIRSAGTPTASQLLQSAGGNFGTAQTYSPVSPGAAYASDMTPVQMSPADLMDHSLMSMNQMTLNTLGRVRRLPDITEDQVSQATSPLGLQ